MLGGFQLDEAMPTVRPARRKCAFEVALTLGSKSANEQRHWPRAQACGSRSAGTSNATKVGVIPLSRRQCRVSGGSPMRCVQSVP